MPASFLAPSLVLILEKQRLLNKGGEESTSRTSLLTSQGTVTMEDADVCDNAEKMYEAIP